MGKKKEKKVDRRKHLYDATNAEVMAFISKIVELERAGVFFNFTVTMDRDSAIRQSFDTPWATSYPESTIITLKLEIPPIPKTE